MKRQYIMVQDTRVLRIKYQENLNTKSVKSWQKIGNSTCGFFHFIILTIIQYIHGLCMVQCTILHSIISWSRHSFDIIYYHHHHCQVHTCVTKIRYLQNSTCYNIIFQERERENKREIKKVEVEYEESLWIVECFTAFPRNYYNFSNVCTCTAIMAWCDVIYVICIMCPYIKNIWALWLCMI